MKMQVKKEFKTNFIPLLKEFSVLQGGIIVLRLQDVIIAVFECGACTKKAQATTYRLVGTSIPDHV